MKIKCGAWYTYKPGGKVHYVYMDRGTVVDYKQSVVQLTRHGARYGCVQGACGTVNLTWSEVQWCIS